MRPINLIPEEERRRSSRGPSAPGGPIAYLIVGALAIALVGVVVLVLTSNQISERESEVATLQVEKAAATAKAEKLTAYTSFEQVAEQRTQTIAGLANSRFDWVRVIKQLSLTLPPNVFFTNLSGSAGGGESGGEGITGPSLTIAGCAPSQNAVAGFVASLKEIDGVTRVELKQSVVGEGAGQATGASACSVGHKAQFQIIVAFDEAPPSPDSTAGIAEATTEAESSTEGSEPESSESESSESESSTTETEAGGSETAPTESTQASTTGSTVGAG
ncbi:MAG TPA: PilN domain-containing protein [Solirubrobacterales bacterium]|nr:PilN domain-containing protein [Solirubrobacterales bacterium]